jgi:hypothetical protein
VYKKIILKGLILLNYRRIDSLHGMQEVSGSNPLFSTYEVS